MIAGLLSFQPAERLSFLLDGACRFSSFNRNSFHKVVLKGFEGGYFLSPGLPYNESDFFFKDELNDIMVLLSGSVYNRSELSRQFNVRLPFSDPELIGRLFLINGPEFVRELNGDFAICVHQPEAGQSFLYRDHLGVRPVAIASGNHSLLFSSDIIGLSRAVSGGKLIDSGYLQKHFKFTDLRKGPSPCVKKLPPGHYLHFTPYGETVHAYWKPGKISENKSLKYETMINELRNIITDSVKIRCDPRFRAGTHVTAGLDSGIVSFLAYREYPGQNKFCGFSWSPGNYDPEDIKYDERDLINKSYNGSGISVVFTSVSKDEFPGYVGNYYNNQGYFSEDKSGDVAVQNGTNLIFTGWGGDEFISTGDRGIDVDMLFRFRLRSFF